MVVKYVPINAENLIEDIDLRPYMYAECESKSNSELNNFTEHDPIVALYEGFDFSIREIRSQLNKQALRVAINHLKIAGIQQRLGQSSKVTLTFTLSAALSNNFVLSAGYLVTSNNGLQFETDTLLVIPAGSITGTVSATSIGEGTVYNVARETIINLTETRAFLQSVTNLEPAQGGLDAESLEEVLSRGFAALRYRGTLITADDFEQEAIRQLGSGSVAKAIGLLNGDKVTFQKGAVHLFVLNPDGSIPNQAQLTELRALMAPNFPTFLQNQSDILINTSLYISPVELLPISINVVAALIDGDNPQVRASQINTDLMNYLKPGNLELGSTLILKEVENVIRQSGIRFIQSVFFQKMTEVSYSDLPMPNNWTTPTLSNLKVTLVDSFEKQYEYLF
jgi:hypothetical protein